MVHLVDLAPVTYAVVAIAATFMAYLTWRSYQNTGNTRLLFVFFAFLTFILKSLLIIVNELDRPHPIEHDVMLVVASLFDVLVVLLLFVPFLGKPRRR